LSLADLRNLPQRTQITRHDCVEGWSAIGKWQGVPLAIVLARAALLPAARFVVFHCADVLEQTLDGTGQYYESIDLIDAFHPPTSRFRSATAPRCGCGSNGSSATSTQNI
jgi:DMSO/TMAO reductase YedYZ molybdopterin-dependent catalytic subunit